MAYAIKNNELLTRLNVGGREVEKVYQGERKVFERCNPNLLYDTNQGGKNFYYNFGGNATTKPKVVCSEIIVDGVRACLMTRNGEANTAWCYSSFRGFKPTEMIPGEKYTLSMDVCLPMSNIDIKFAQADNQQVMSQVIKWNVPANTWTHIEGTYTMRGSVNIGKQMVYINFIFPENTTAMFKNIKLEKGTTATPWCPNPADLKIGGGNTLTLSLLHSHRHLSTERRAA